MINAINLANGFEMTSTGTMLHEVTKTTTIEKTAHFELRMVENIVLNTMKYFIYWDGEIVNEYKNLKTAKSFFKDFTA